MRTKVTDHAAASAVRSALPDRSDMWGDAIGLPPPSNIVTHLGAAVTVSGVPVTHTP